MIDKPATICLIAARYVHMLPIENRKSIDCFAICRPARLVAQAFPSQSQAAGPGNGHRLTIQGLRSDYLRTNKLAAEGDRTLRYTRPRRCGQPPRKELQS